MNEKIERKNGAKYLTAANCLTSLRILGAGGLVFLPTVSPAFFIVYTLTGLTDALDGWAARKTGTASKFGARLDSIADILFCAAMMFRLLPMLWEVLPVQIWYAAAAVLFVRLSSYCAAAIKFHCFASLHTYLNKLTGTALFLLPYTLAFSSGIAYTWGICAIAFAAASEELAIHILCKSYHPDVKSIFTLK